ncbi:MAG: hypothetical protein ACXWIU_03415 [Limisphaerales bacterium]
MIDEGTVIANSTGGTVYVTALTIGDPLGANCSFVNPQHRRQPQRRPLPSWRVFLNEFLARSA